MELEWDEKKNRANLQKHGLDFRDARHLDWDNASYVEDRRFAYPEPRYWAFATWNHSLYMVAFCIRGTKGRIISFRKANRKEVRNHGAK